MFSRAASGTGARPPTVEHPRTIIITYLRGATAWKGKWGGARAAAKTKPTLPGYVAAAAAGERPARAPLFGICSEPACSAPSASNRRRRAVGNRRGRRVGLDPEVRSSERGKIRP